MNWQSFADPDFSSRMCWTLLHSLWQVALLAAAARGVEWLWGRRAVERSYAVHAAALALGLALLPLTFWCSGKSSNSVANIEAAAPGGSERANLPAAALAPPLVPAVAATGQPLVPAQATTIPWSRVAPWICAAYALGVLAMMARLLWAMWVAQRLAARVRPLSGGPLLAQLQKLCRDWSLRAVPVLAVAEKIAVPQVVGRCAP